MIPNRVLNDLARHERVAVLTRDGEIHFLVHPTSDDPAEIRTRAARDGFGVLATHLRDRVAILELVESRERDVGGES